MHCYPSRDNCILCMRQVFNTQHVAAILNDTILRKTVQKFTCITWGIACNSSSSPPCRYLYNASLQWRHNGHDGVPNHQPHHCSLNRLFGRRSKKTSKAPRHWPLCWDRWFLRTNGQLHEECFHLMTSSFYNNKRHKFISRLNFEKLIVFAMGKIRQIL